MDSRRLAFSLNDDGTVTLRCDADAFFANANAIRRLLAGEEANNSREIAQETHSFPAFWAQFFHKAGQPPPASRDLSVRATEILLAGFYLNQELGLEAFSRADLQRILASLPGERSVKTGALVHLTRKGWLERVRRGLYRLGNRAFNRIRNLRALDRKPALPGPRTPALPSLVGLSRFLREVPANRKWRKVLLVGYFLREHCGIVEFDKRLIAACFQRTRGVDAPGSLSSLLSQVLCKRHRLIERGSGRGLYRITHLALEQLRHEARIIQANALHRMRAVAKTG